MCEIWCRRLRVSTSPTHDLLSNRAPGDKRPIAPRLSMVPQGLGAGSALRGLSLWAFGPQNPTKMTFWTYIFDPAISRRDPLSHSSPSQNLLSASMPFYERTCSPGVLRPITIGSYRPASLLHLERFCRCAIQRLEGVGQQSQFPLIGASRKHRREKAGVEASPARA